MFYQKIGHSTANGKYCKHQVTHEIKISDSNHLFINPKENQVYSKIIIIYYYLGCNSKRISWTCCKGNLLHPSNCTSNESMGAYRDKKTYIIFAFCIYVFQAFGTLRLIFANGCRYLVIGLKIQFNDQLTDTTECQKCAWHAEGCCDTQAN